MQKQNSSNLITQLAGHPLASLETHAILLYEALVDLTNGGTVPVRLHLSQLVSYATFLQNRGSGGSDTKHVKILEDQNLIRVRRQHRPFTYEVLQVVDRVDRNSYDILPPSIIAGVLETRDACTAEKHATTRAQIFQTACRDTQTSLSDLPVRKIKKKVVVTPPPEKVSDLDKVLNRFPVHTRDAARQILTEGQIYINLEGETSHITVIYKEDL